jgi:HAMP domain-containing protein
MGRPRLVLALLLAAALGFGAGFFMRANLESPLEVRAREAVERVERAFRSLTR